MKNIWNVTVKSTGKVRCQSFFAEVNKRLSIAETGNISRKPSAAKEVKEKEGTLRQKKRRDSMKS